MIKRNSIFGLLAAVLIVLIFLLLWKRSSESEDWPEQSVKPTPAETALRGHQEREPVARAAHAADTLKSDARILALQRKVDSLTARLSTQAPKAQQSAQEFQKTPTFDNCVQALADCQEESETQRYALAVQSRMLAAADSAKRKDRKEIARSYGVNDSLMAGWDNANKALRKAQKPRHWGLGVQIGAGATNARISPYIGIGLSYNIATF